MLDLGEAKFFPIAAGAGLAQAGAFFAEAPGEAQGQVHLPVVAVARPQVGGGVFGGRIGAVVAGLGSEIELGQAGVLGRGYIDLLLADGGEGGGVFGGVGAGAGEAGGEVDHGFVDRGQGDGADRIFKSLLAQQAEQLVLAVAGGLAGEQQVAGGGGDAHLGLQHFEIGGDAGLAAGAVFLVEFLPHLERERPDADLFAGEGEIGVGDLDVAHDGEDLGGEIGAGAGGAEAGAFQCGVVDARAGAF